MSHLFRSIDVETTSTEDDASVIEIGWTDVHINDETKILSVQPHESRLVIPRSKITHAARGVHHITDQELEKHGVSFEVAHKEATNCNPVAMVAHNADFEKKFIHWDGAWIDTLKIALVIWPNSEDHKNQTLRYVLEVDNYFSDRELAFPPHRAGPDSYVTAFIAAVATMSCPVDELLKISDLPKQYPKVPFGKHRGIEWGQIPEDYLIWMLSSTNDLESDILWNAKQEMQNRYVDKISKKVDRANTIEELRHIWRNESYEMGRFKIDKESIQYINILKIFRDKKELLQRQTNGETKP